MNSNPPSGQHLHVLAYKFVRLYLNIKHKLTVRKVADDNGNKLEENPIFHVIHVKNLITKIDTSLMTFFPEQSWSKL